MRTSIGLPTLPVDCEELAFRVARGGVSLAGDPAEAGGGRTGVIFVLSEATVVRAGALGK